MHYYTVLIYIQRLQHLVRLGGMQELQREFPNAVIGLSDHTVNNNACLAATALGASILERHFTDSRQEKDQILYVLWIQKN